MDKDELEILFNLLCEREHTNSEHNFWLKLYQKVRKKLDKQEKIKKIVDKWLEAKFPDKDDGYYMGEIFEVLKQ